MNTSLVLTINGDTKAICTIPSNISDKINGPVLHNCVHLGTQLQF